jgi:hypothetical protein
MKWIKLWPEEWLNGTLRFTLDHKKRAVWADLLCLGGKSRIPGVICAGEESGKCIGYPVEYLAGITSVTPQELEETLKVFESQERVTTERETGRLIIRLLNWGKYQVDYSRQSRYKAKKKRLHQQATPKGDALDDAKGDGEVEVEVEVDKNHCANPSGSHASVLSQTTPKPPDEEHLATVQRAWEYYLEKLDKNPKLLTFTPLRKSKGLARLRECVTKAGGDLARAEGLMRVAVDALASSDFHIGKNDRGRRYDSWEKNLFGAREQLERWLEQS